MQNSETDASEMFGLEPGIGKPITTEEAVKYIAEKYREDNPYNGVMPQPSIEGLNFDLGNTADKLLSKASRLTVCYVQEYSIHYFLQQKFLDKVVVSANKEILKREIGYVHDIDEADGMSPSFETAFECQINCTMVTTPMWLLELADEKVGFVVMDALEFMKHLDNKTFIPIKSM